MSEAVASYTSLEGSANTEHRGERLSRSQRYRFRYCRSERAQYERVLLRGEADIARREKGIACGSHQVLYQHRETGQCRVAGNYCEARTCPACCRSRQRKQFLQLDEWIRLYSRNDARFITLTLAHSDAPLALQLTDLQEAFKRLRRHILWKTSVKYGKAVIEITYNNKTEEWHPHLHVIAIGLYIPQGKLSNAWRTASCGSMVCDIRKIKNGTNIAGYVSKGGTNIAEYVSGDVGVMPKITNPEHADRRALEYYIALRNRRMLLSFAGAPPLPPLPKSEDSPADDPNWKQIGSLEDLLERAEKGDPEAEQMLGNLAGRLNPEAPPSPP